MDEADRIYAELLRKAEIARSEAEAAAKRRQSKKHVIVRILPLGDGKVHTGDYDADSKVFSTYKRGDKFSVAYGIAEQLQARGLGEILEDEPEAPPAPIAAPIDAQPAPPAPTKDTKAA